MTKLITRVVCDLKKHTISGSIQHRCPSLVLNSWRKSGSLPSNSKILLRWMPASPPKFPGAVAFIVTAGQRSLVSAGGSNWDVLGSKAKTHDHNQRQRHCQQGSEKRCSEVRKDNVHNTLSVPAAQTTLTVTTRRPYNNDIEFAIGKWKRKGPG